MLQCIGAKIFAVKTIPLGAENLPFSQTVRLNYRSGADILTSAGKGEKRSFDTITFRYIEGRKGDIDRLQRILH